MSSTLQLLVMVCVTTCARACYWNAHCPYQLYSSKTPYDAVRGDIRDYDVPSNCEAISIWTLNRHGNRSPHMRLLNKILKIIKLKDEIVAGHEAGRGHMCAQDIENFSKWTWNASLEDSQSLLTTAGYEELFGIAKRIQDKYPNLLKGDEDNYYFRSFKEDTTTTSSARAFIHGLTSGTNLTLAVDEITIRDDIVAGDANCKRHSQLLNSQKYKDKINEFFQSADVIDVVTAVQQRLGLITKLIATEIYTIYEICRYERSWTKNYQSPWCAAFSNHDLEVLEYYDDFKYYHGKGYGSWVNVKLGGPTLKNLYEVFEAAVRGHGRKVTSYFTHLTIVNTVWCALGMFKDSCPLQASARNSSRLFRMSEIGVYAQNLIFVLNSCKESGIRTHRVQFFINEKETELCPLQGCTWQQFQDKFEPFTSANLDFCRLDYLVPESVRNLTSTCV